MASNQAVSQRNLISSTMFEKLRGVVPDFEIEHKSKLAAEIIGLKKKSDAIILGHNYMEPALFHLVPDFTGDSLDLCRKAATTNKSIIVFCGVRFMAETAKLLNPDKTVLLPSAKGGCSLAASITAADVRKLREKFPDVPVVTYINTYADVKAESDICCTSTNAAQVVESLKSDTVIFLPDEYLAANIAKQTGKHIIFPTKANRNTNPAIDYQLIGWHGKCEVHEKFTVEDIENVRRQFPDTLILAHPECSPEVVAESDFTGSTNSLIKHVQQTTASRYLLLTECSMGDNIMTANPQKNMLRICSVRCPHMNEITMEETFQSLQLQRYVIEIPQNIAERARKAVERMIAIG